MHNSQGVSLLLLGNVISLRPFAKILGAMWASTPTECAFILTNRRVR